MAISDYAPLNGTKQSLQEQTKESSLSWIKQRKTDPYRIKRNKKVPPSLGLNGGKLPPPPPLIKQRKEPPSPRSNGGM